MVDVCLYTFSDGPSLLWVLVYVDDALIVDNHPDLRARFVRDLGSRFPIEDKDDLSWILNVAVARDRPRRQLTLSQGLYVSDLLQRHDAYISSATTRTFKSPLGAIVLDPSDSPTPGSPEFDAMASKRDTYMAIVGGLLWLANMSRPDLAYAASQLSRFMTNPGPLHFAAAVRVLCYLRDSPRRDLVFSPDHALPLLAHVDSNWEAQFSCTGALLFYFGCPIHWFSKTQRSVSLSSAEAEYFGAMLAAREVLFVRDLLVDLNLRPSGPTLLCSDSKSAVNMSLDPVAFKKTKHIMRAAAFLRDLVAKEAIAMRHVPGDAMLADFLTKAMGPAPFCRLLALLENCASILTKHVSLPI